MAKRVTDRDYHSIDLGRVGGMIRALARITGISQAKLLHRVTLLQLSEWISVLKSITESDSRMSLDACSLMYEMIAHLKALPSPRSVKQGILEWGAQLPSDDAPDHPRDCRP